LKSKHLIAVGAAVVLVAILYFGGSTVLPKKDLPAEKAPAAMADNMQAPGMTMPEPADFDSMLTAIKKKLPPEALNEISKEEAIVAGNDTQQKILALEALGKLWQKKQHRLIAAHYFGESGKLENSEKKLNFAAHLLTEELHELKNPNVRQWAAVRAIDFYSASLQLNPVNDTTRIDLAAVFINGTGETMKGIEQLLTIVRRDSTNIPANIILGRMAIESGQLDKAIQRGLTVLSVDKENLEAHLFLAEGYKRKGEVEKAKQVLNDAKKIMNNPDFSKDVDAYMSTF
jgi:thioredoxin-like negative regulator of GroEL